MPANVRNAVGYVVPTLLNASTHSSSSLPRAGDLNCGAAVVCGSGAAPAKARGAAMELAVTAHVVAHPRRA
jgi:hypothetical protein